MTPVGDAEFSGLMAPLGPWAASGLVAVAVSGGADSLALAWLAARWGRPTGLVVDHGIRRESADEAAVTVGRLASFGMPARVLRLPGIRVGPGLAARARRARYAALTEAAGEAGCVDLLLGHHAADQAETLLMRRLGGSGEWGRAGMARIVETASLRLVRPLLAMAPGRLRATLRQARIGWVEDPSNRDQTALRPRLRAGLADPEGAGPEIASLVAQAAGTAAVRAAAETAVAGALARHAMIRPEGFAVLDAAPLPPPALAALLRMVTGAEYAPSGPGLAELARRLRPAVLGGARLLPAGRLGPGFLLVREAAAMAAPVAAVPGAVWDRRFRLAPGAKPPAGASFGALGEAASRLRSVSDLPYAVLASLPAIRVRDFLVAVPHLGYPDGRMCFDLPVAFRPSAPAAAAPFRV